MSGFVAGQDELRARVMEAFRAFLPGEWIVEDQLKFSGIRPDLIALHPERGVVVVKLAVLPPEFRFAPVGDATDNASPPEDGQPVHNAGQVDEWDGRADARYELAEWVDELDRLMGDVPDSHKRRVLRGVLLVVQAIPVDERSDILDRVPCDYLDLRWLDAVPSDAAVMAGLVTEIVPQAFADVPGLPASTWSRLRREVLGTEGAVLGMEPPATIEFDRRQRVVLDHLEGPGLKRIRGAAGSGKSTILAKVVADRIRAGGSVLVVVRNKSMRQILKTRALHFMNRETPDATERQMNQELLKANAFIVWQDRWWKRVCVETGLDERRRRIYGMHEAQNSSPEIEIEVINLVAMGLSSTWGMNNPNLSWDLIIIDEAQNMLSDNWRCLRRCLRAGGTAIVCSDPTQSMYGPRPWTEERMEGFRNIPWRTLNTTHRLPDDYTDLVREFLDRFPTDDEVVLPDPPAQRDFSMTSLYRTATSTGFQKDGIVRAVQFALSDLGFLPHQVAFLVPTNKRGRLVARDLSRAGIAVTHTFRESLRIDFGMVDGVRGASYHSYAGWESPCVVVDTKFAPKQTNANGLLYSGLTRIAKRDLGSALIVVQGGNKFDDFFNEKCETIDV